MRTSTLILGAAALLLAAAAGATGKSSKTQVKPTQEELARSMLDAFGEPERALPYFPSAWKACRADADCIDVAVWCLGMHDTVNAKHRADAEAMEKKACPHPGGMLFIRQKISCNAGHCELAGPVSAADAGR